MRLEKASSKAIKYACMNFHYAKSVPVNVFGWNVFNGSGDWCGVVLFGSGANNNLAQSIGLPQGSVLELVRVALNGKQGGGTGKALSISLRLVRSLTPLCKVVISYADPEQGHIGVLYQATNWVYVGKSKPQREVINPITGKMIHKRTANALFGSIVGLKKTEIFFKYKYIFAVDKSFQGFCKGLAMPYPKKQNAGEALLEVCRATSSEEAFDATAPLNNSRKTAVKCQEAREI